MHIKLAFLMICASTAYCQKTISCGNDGEWDKENLEDIRYELESIQQLLLSQEKAEPCNDRQAIQEMKSELQDIRQIVSNQSQVLETLRDKWNEIENRKANCPVGFDYLSEIGSCYRVIFELMTWDNATERCRGMMPEVHLAAITSQEENDAVVRYLRPQFIGDNSSCRPNEARWPQLEDLIWIGGQTRNPRQCGSGFVWRPLKEIEMPFNYTNWYKSYPDCYESVENCVQFVSGRNYSWNDYNCDLLSCAVCERQV